MNTIETAKRPLLPRYIGTKYLYKSIDCGYFAPHDDNAENDSKLFLFP